MSSTPPIITLGVKPMNKFHLNLKPKFIALILALITIIIAIIIFLTTYFRPATLILQIAPTSATVTIDGKTYTNGSHQLSPKKQAEVTISADGFQPKTLHLDLKSGTVSKIITYLVPNDNDWVSYTKMQNKDSLSLLASAYGYQPWDFFYTGPKLLTDDDTSADDFIHKVSLKGLGTIELDQCDGDVCVIANVEYNYFSECASNLCLKISGYADDITPEILNLVRINLAANGFNLDDYTYFYSNLNINSSTIEEIEDIFENEEDEDIPDDPPDIDYESYDDYTDDAASI